MAPEARSSLVGLLRALTGGRAQEIAAKAAREIASAG
jgi:hypothetical protein